MSLLKSAGIYVFGSFFVQGLSFITLPIFSALMPPEDYGLYASYSFWIVLSNAIIGLQAASSVNNAYVDYGKDRIYSYAFATTPIAIFSFLPIGLICLLCSGPVTSLLELPLIAVMLGLVQSLLTYFFNTLLNVYRIEDKPVRYLLLSVVNASVGVFGSIVLLLLDTGLQPYATRVVSSLVAALLTGGFSLFILSVKSRMRFNGSYVRYAVKLTSPLVFHALAGMMLARINQMLLLNMINSAEAGVYAYASNYGQVVSTLFTACNAAFVPWFYRSLSEGGSKTDRNVVIKGYVGAFSLGACAYVLLCPIVVSALSPESYAGASKVSSVVSFSFLLNFLYSIPANYEFYQKKTKYIAVGTVAACVVDIALCLLLITPFSSMGAAFSSLIAYTFLFCGHSFIVSGVLKIKEYVGARAFLPWILLGLVVTAIALSPANTWLGAVIGLILIGLAFFKIIRISKRFG